MEILDFRFISPQDRTDETFRFKGAWSRFYEYPLVLDLIDKYCDKPDPTIHNSAWGFEGVHLIFKNYLSEKYPICVESSDIRYSNEPDTFFYDITCKAHSLHEKYDIVLNISTVEEVRNFPHVKVFDNLYDQVKPNGLLIITFDYPGLNLKAFENEFGQKISDELERLNGKNSANPNDRYGHLNCGVLCVRKTDK